MSQAKNYLSQAQWIVLQEPSCPDSVKYRIHRVYGIIHAAKRQFDAARQCFADDVSVAMFLYYAIYIRRPTVSRGTAFYQSACAMKLVPTELRTPADPVS